MDCHRADSGLAHDTANVSSLCTLATVQHESLEIFGTTEKAADRWLGGSGDVLSVKVGAETQG